MILLFFCLLRRRLDFILGCNDYCFQKIDVRFACKFSQRERHLCLCDDFVICTRNPDFLVVHKTFSESAPTQRRSSITFKHEIIEFPLGGASVLRERYPFCANSFRKEVPLVKKLYTAVPLVSESYNFVFKSGRATSSGSGSLKKGLI